MSQSETFSRDRVYVVIGDKMLRVHCAMHLTALGFLTKTFCSGTGFLADVPLLAPGCVIADMTQADSDAAFLGRLEELCPRFQTVLIVDKTEAPAGDGALPGGAVALLQKPFSEEALLHTVRMAHRRQQGDAEGGQAPEAFSEGRFALLTPRELEVLEGMVAGLSNKMIALQLSLSPRTVESYRARIKHKTQARNMSHFIHLATAARSLAPALPAELPPNEQP
jgi:two-component system response regulator FixJ